MIPLNDTAEFEWIAQRRTTTPHAREVKATGGVNLSCVMPLCFERYTKILHRLDGHYENIDHPLSAEENAMLGIPDCSIVRELVVGKRRSSSTSRIFWKEAAHALEVPYASEINHMWFSNQLRPYPECWPRFIWGPHGGTLGSDERHALVCVLTAVSGGQECCFRLAEIPYIGTEQNLLFAGTLDEVEEFFVNGSFQFTPEYW